MIVVILRRSSCGSNRYSLVQVIKFLSKQLFPNCLNDQFQSFLRFTMEACIAVEKEIDKVINNFASIREHGSRTVEELIDHLTNLKRELEIGKL